MKHQTKKINKTEKQDDNNDDDDLLLLIIKKKPKFIGYSIK